MDCAQYTPSEASRWNEFVDKARNSTFLFRREYMDYHSDRFTDHSLIFSRGDRICALLPANLTPDGVLYSHQGLTYGGFILPPRHINGEDVLEMADTLAAHCRAEGIGSMVYKALPYIYLRPFAGGSLRPVPTRSDTSTHRTILDYSFGSPSRSCRRYPPTHPQGYGYGTRHRGNTRCGPFLADAERVSRRAPQCRAGPHRS